MIRELDLGWPLNDHPVIRMAVLTSLVSYEHGVMVLSHRIEAGS